MPRGFTSLELAITLGLLALIGSLSALAFRTYDGLALALAVNNLHAHIISQQQRARMAGKEHTMTIYAGQSRYQIEQTTYSLPSSVVFGFLPNVKGPPGKPSSFITQPITFAHDTITFHPNGIMQPGTIYLTNKQATLLYALTIAISPYSLIRCYRYHDRWELIS